MTPIFNYIITIHNKEDLIERVMNAVIKCCNEKSFIYPVLDGCTDKSEEIVDKIIKENPSVAITKIIVNDVHEILSINAALKGSNQSIEGYNIILQDDVILSDQQIEKKVVQLYKKMGPQLGYVSFRLGANLKPDILQSTEGAPFKDYIENAFGHGTPKSKVLFPGQFAFRKVAIKSPVCIPTLIVNKYGFLDENLSPCFHDDTEYCLRMLLAGYKNGVFGIEFHSELEWGGTRKTSNDRLYQHIVKNMDYIRTKYQKQMNTILSIPDDEKVISVEGLFDPKSNKKAQNQYSINKRNRIKFETQQLTVIGKIKYQIKSLFKEIIS